MAPPRSVGLSGPALVLLLSSAPAEGHPQYALTTVNRYTKLALQPRGQLRIIYTLMVGDAPAFELRRKADRDGDGRLSAAEGAALAAEFVGRAQEGLSLQLDGQPVSLRFAEPTLGLAGSAVAPAAFSVDASATLTVPAGRPHELRLEDRTAIPPVGEVEILVEEGPGVRLVESCQGPPRPGQPERTTAFRFYGPAPSSLSDRSVTLRFIEPQAQPPTAPRRWPLAMLVAAGAAMATAAGAFARRRRRSKS